MRVDILGSTELEVADVGVDVQGMDGMPLVGGEVRVVLLVLFLERLQDVLLLLLWQVVGGGVQLLLLGALGKHLRPVSEGALLRERVLVHFLNHVHTLRLRQPVLVMFVV